MRERHLWETLIEQHAPRGVEADRFPVGGLQDKPQVPRRISNSNISWRIIDCYIVRKLNFLTCLSHPLATSAGSTRKLGTQSGRANSESKELEGIRPAPPQSATSKCHFQMLIKEAEELV